MLETKSLGQYFTPTCITQFMVNLITKKSKELEILEPCAGKGAFLKELISKGYSNLTGIEIDASLTFESPIPVQIGNFFDFPIEKKYDLVIGNPPYVRWKNLNEEQRGYFFASTFWHKRMNGLTDILQPFIFKSVDHLKPGGELIFITPLFWMQTLHAEPLRRFLLENGFFELIVNFHETRIFSQANLNLIIFKYQKKFNSKKANNNKRPVRVVNYWHKGSLNQNIIDRILFLLQTPSWSYNSSREGDLEFFLTHQPYNSKLWRFIPLKIEEEIKNFEKICQFSPIFNIEGQNLQLSSLYSANDLISLGYSKKAFVKRKLGKKTYFQAPQTASLSKYLSHDIRKANIPNKRFIRIGDVVEIGNGMVSGLDKAFRLKIKNKLNKKELRLVIPVIKAKALRRYFPEYVTEYFLVKPGVIRSEDILERDFPALYEQLKPFRQKLENRYQYNRIIPYWEWVFIRNYSLMKHAKELICVPCKDRYDSRGYFRFALSKNETFTTQDVTVMVKFGWVRESSEYISAFLNSTKVYEWVTNKGLIRGGVAEFSEKPLSSIPFRLINWDSSLERKIHTRITSLVQEIYLKKKEDLNKIRQINDLIMDLIN
ncbi:MAG: Eco57I restriction-modification methylase domain-containing protein [Candidatus Hermodarchaeota archaeon]